MNGRGKGIILDNFKFRVVDADAVAAETWLTEDDQLLTGGDHLLDVMQIEPAKSERLTQRVWIRLLQGCFEDLFPAAEPAERGFDHLATQTDRLIGFFAREMRKFMPIFITSRIMSEKIFRRLDPEPAQGRDFRSGDPVQLAQGL